MAHPVAGAWQRRATCKAGGESRRRMFVRHMSAPTSQTNARPRHAEPGRLESIHMYSQADFTIVLRCWLGIIDCPHPAAYSAAELSEPLLCYSAVSVAGNVCVPRSDVPVGHVGGWTSPAISHIHAMEFGAVRSMTRFTTTVPRFIRETCSVGSRMDHFTSCPNFALHVG